MRGPSGSARRRVIRSQRASGWMSGFDPLVFYSLRGGVMMSSRTRKWVAGLALVVSIIAAAHVVASTRNAAPKVQTILAFGTMIGNDPDETINGIDSDDLPWVVKQADGLLTTDGTISLVIKGLVFANDPSVPP